MNFGGEILGLELKASAKFAFKSELWGFQYSIPTWRDPALFLRSECSSAFHL